MREVEVMGWGGWRPLGGTGKLGLGRWEQHGAGDL